MDHREDNFESRLLYYGSLFRKRWLWIAGFVIVAVVGAFVFSRLSPKYYVSTVVILPSVPDIKGGMGFSLGEESVEKSEKGNGANLGSLAGIMGGPTSADILKSIMQSRRIAEALIEQLNLKEYYGTETLGQTRDALKSETTLLVNREKAFFITVESRDPKMAATIANAYAENLDRLNRELSVTSATKNRRFIERRLEEKKQQLAQAEDVRKEFQVKHRTLLVTDKAQAAIRTTTSIEENILGLEIELAALKEYATPSHPQMNQLDAQIKALRLQSQRLQQQQQDRLGVTNAEPVSKSLATGFFPPMPQMPVLALEYLRLTREVKIHEAIVTMLTGQYEHARIAEAKDTPTVQILDPAIPAEMKSRPMTLKNMQIAGLLALLLGLIGVMLHDYWMRLKQLEETRLARLSVAMAEHLLPAASPVANPVNGGNGSSSTPLHQKPQQETEPIG
jgi:uncharacterized protein involved in exopolysaccharide biosynthesis